MATIIEGAMWTLTDAAAEVMVEKGLVYLCEADHHTSVLQADKPIYHRRHDAPQWFGFTTIHGAIADAEIEAEDPNTKSVWDIPLEV